MFDVPGIVLDKSIGWLLKRFPMPGLPLAVAIVLLLAAFFWPLSDTAKKRVFGKDAVMGRKAVYAGAMFIGAVIMFGATAYGYSYADKRTTEQDLKANFIKNPRFENHHEYWGSGYMEDRVRNGNHKRDVERLPFVVSEPGGLTGSLVETNSTGHHDSQVVRGNGKGSWRFFFGPPVEDQRYGTLSQRVHGLQKNHPYILRFYVKATPETDPNAFFVVTDLPWRNKRNVALTPDWREESLRFNPGDLHYADIRFIIDKPGTVWITDDDVREQDAPPPLWQLRVVEPAQTSLSK